MMVKTYKELSRLKTFTARFEYLKLKGIIGESTFGFDRYLNQALYHSIEWLNIRDQVILRDNGCDLGVPGYEIYGYVYVHHINPITKADLLGADPLVFDLNNLITSSKRTHQAIHFGDESLLDKPIIKRRPGDTIPWRT